MRDNSSKPNNHFDSHYIEQLHLRHCKAIRLSEKEDDLIEQGVEGIEMTMYYKVVIGCLDWMKENMEPERLK